MKKLLFALLLLISSFLSIHAKITITGPSAESLFNIMKPNGNNKQDQNDSYIEGIDYDTETFKETITGVDATCVKETYSKKGFPSGNTINEEYHYSCDLGIEVNSRGKILIKKKGVTDFERDEILNKMAYKIGTKMSKEEERATRAIVRKMIEEMEKAKTDELDKYFWPGQ